MKTTNYGCLAVAYGLKMVHYVNLFLFHTIFT